MRISQYAVNDVVRIIDVLHHQVRLRFQLFAPLFLGDKNFEHHRRDDDELEPKSLPQKF